MGVKYNENWKIEDLNFTIIMNSKCNLSCKYCPLINENIEIEYNILDDYANFFYKNKEELAKNINNIVFVFSWWEPLLSFKKIRYFIEKMYNFQIHTKFVIYTNWILLSNEIIKYLVSFKDYKTRIIFYISIDWDFDIMSKYRIKLKKDFLNIIKNIFILKKFNFNFSLSKVISEEKSLDLFNSLKFLHKFGLEKLDCLPLSFYFKNWYSKEHLKEIIKWYDLFINYLINKWFSESNIMEYLWLPDDLRRLKRMYKSDYWLYWNINGDIYPILDLLPIFSISRTVSDKEKKIIFLWNINDNEKILKIIKNYNSFEEKYYELWKNWHHREFPNEVNAYSILDMYLIKKLFINKYLPQDKYDYIRNKNITFLEKYYYSNEDYPHENLWYFINNNIIFTEWKKFLINKSSKEKISLVVNIPFCETKCFYCVHEVSILNNEKQIDNYLNFLEKESKLHNKIFGKIKLNYLYIWWWTPTILSEMQLVRLYDIINKNYDLSWLEENMIEFSPNTYTQDKVKIIKRYWVNKVTFWVQDIDEKLMKDNNRYQKKEKILSLFNELKNNNIRYINIDIMAWLKGQNFNNFKETFDFVNSLKPSNICLNIYKPANKVLYKNSWLDFFSDSYLKERQKMINYFNNNYTNNSSNEQLYRFQDPNTSFLSLWYWTNWHIFWKLYYKFNSLNDYYNFLSWKENITIWYEINIEHEIIKYVILNFKNNWISFKEMIRIFWDNIVFDKIYQKIIYLKKKNLVEVYNKGTDIYYKFIKDSDLDYNIYIKIFYTDDILKANKKLLNEDSFNIDDFLKFYFVN